MGRTGWAAADPNMLPRAAAPRTERSGGEAMYIRNPVEWGVDQLRHAGAAVEALGRSRPRDLSHPGIRHIGLADLGAALARGIEDFAACRTDVAFLCLVYPIVGLVLARLVFGYAVLQLLFPLASGFALVGPVAAVGLYEMSRRREQGRAVSWADACAVVRAPGFPRILSFGLLLLAIFLAWIGAALGIYDLTLGPEPPATVGSFLHDLFTTARGAALIGAGVGVGFLLAALVLAISVVSVPLLLDRDIGVANAIGASLRAVAANPGPMAAWGLIVAAGLAVASIPLFLGLIVAMPVLGHATWHLYRRVVIP
jgi:uncharacterized membrane protein